MNKSDLFWQTYLNLENELLTLSRYISITDYYFKIDKSGNQKVILTNNQLEVFSPYISDLLVRCCVEIEAISKELYFDNGGAKKRGSTDVYFDTDCIKLLNDKWQIGEKEVMVVSSQFDFAKEDNKTLKPLDKAWKRSKVYWAKAYQSVKHDRYNSLSFGNIKAVIAAMASLYLLNIYSRDVSIKIKYRETKNVDYSFGSKIFAVKSPSDDNLNNIINGVEYNGILKSGTSPFILKYADSTYNQVLDIHKAENDAIKSFVLSQPEMRDPEFVSKITNLLKNNNKGDVSITREIFKYRINKKYPDTLPFGERKRLLLGSDEYNSSIAKNILKDKDITKGTINNLIENIAFDNTIRLEMDWVRRKTNVAFDEGMCEILLDKNNVMYKRNV